MSLITKRVYGALDILPKDVYKWQFIEEIMREEAETHGYKEIRTPVFEHTELFKRGVGETTDVVQKEMYTFDSKSGTSLTLRPEGTAGAARALLENALYNDGLPIKLCYFTSCYRYEKKQANRYREFRQFGYEIYGTQNPISDAELIMSINSLFERLQLEDVSIEINSIGCPVCRKDYHKALKEYFESHKGNLCKTCLDRLDKNPMRILDCKEETCSKIAQKAPVSIQYLCDECDTHFNSVKEYLDVMEIEYIVNPHIVRGLDYYTKTVFEFVTKSIGTQGTICGGGRYDGLIEQLGGQSMPSLGFALGMERLLALLDAQGIEIPQPASCDIFIATMGQKANLKAISLIKELRETSINAEFDNVGRSLRAQMKYANKIKAKYSMVLGDDEIENNKASVKNMENGEKIEINLDEAFIEEFANILIEDRKNIISNLLDGLGG